MEEREWLEAVDPEVLRRRRERVLLIAGGILLFLLAAVVAYWLRPPKAPEKMVLLAAQYAVESRIQIRGKLHFSSPVETQIVETAEDRYLVRGWVQDLAADGRSSNYFYSATVEVDPNRGDYEIRDITVLPQD